MKVLIVMTRTENFQIDTQEYKEVFDKRGDLGRFRHPLGASEERSVRFTRHATSRICSSVRSRHSVVNKVRGTGRSMVFRTINIRNVRRKEKG